MTLRTRRSKGSTLTWDEGDDNFAHTWNQPGHGFAVGDLVYRDSTTTWAKARANAEATLAEGIISWVSGDWYEVCTKDGTIVTVTHGHAGGTGTLIFTSQSTAGERTTTEPASGIVQSIGKVMDTTHILFRLGPVAY